jgi:hypothetical protein
MTSVRKIHDPRLYYAGNAAPRQAVRDLEAHFTGLKEQEFASNMSGVFNLMSQSWRSHLRGHYPKVQWGDGIDSLDTSGSMQGLNVIEYENIIIALKAGELPTMCGGSTIYIANAQYMSGVDLKTMCNGSDYGGYLSGSTYIEYYDEEYDDYNEGTVVSGPSGQVLVTFSTYADEVFRNTCMDFLHDLLAKYVYEGDQDADLCLPSVTRVRWLTSNMVGLFTEYTEAYEDYGCYTPQNHEQLSRVNYPGRYYYDNSRPVLTMSYNRVYMQEEKLAVYTYVNSFVPHKHLGVRTDTIIRENLMPMIMDMARDMRRGCTCVLTDNDQSAETMPLKTSDLIEWFCAARNADSDEHKILTNALLKALYSFEPNYVHSGEVSITPFDYASNPNEGAHGIMGVAICEPNHTPQAGVVHRWEW